MMFLKKQRS